MFAFYSSSSNLVNVAKYKKFNTLQLLTNIFSRQLKGPSNPVYIPVNEDAEEILENYYIPGKYQHFLKKNRRKLKKEAREESYFGKEPTLKYTSRKSRIELYPNITEEITYIDGEKFVTPVVSNNSTQRNLAQRLNRAIIKCNDQVPHAFLSSTFIRVVNISISPNLKIARIWWRPEGQKGISKAAVENSFNQHITQYRSMLQRSMCVKKPPKIIFCREDLQLKDINKILDQIEEEFNGNQQQQQQEDTKLEKEKELTDGLQISISPNLKIARIWWRPEGQKGISKAAVENSFNQHITQYRSMLQRSMCVKKPPKIIFCREDLQLKDINKILDQIEEEFNGNQQQQQQEDTKLEKEKELTDGLQVLSSLDDNDIKSSNINDHNN
ncbi:hypothetical protein Glove_51g78 [Diversispora epigaea]|uniref:Ribosome-binding factor A n=1 Tax=Diversispora epigaea TaxID=1348612 RepID=A0A397JPP6_9GLOM|nr:hypothetical protein Glove_51g78 [Diversispora epigaea]